MDRIFVEVSVSIEYLGRGVWELGGLGVMNYSRIRLFKFFFRLKGYEDYRNSVIGK